MEGFANFFTTVIDFLNLLWDYVSNLASSLVMLLRLIPTFYVLPAFLQGTVFAPVAVSMALIVLIAVVKIIIGRENT